MRRLFLLHALAFITILSAYAKHVSPEEAMTRVAAEKSIVGMRAPALASMTCVETLQTSAKVDAVYIFKGNGGAMFLPADDRISAVLGYVDSETEGEMPEQLQWWLGEYVREIEYLQSQPEISAGQYVLAGAKNSSAQRASLSPISPKLTTIWNQTTPFNNLCPLVNGERSVTGCVATAGAQIMKYFEYPSSSMSGTITYNDSGTTRSLSLSGKTFDWSNMLNSYNGSYTTTQANAVAFLMEACGYAAKMNYSPEASGTQTINLLSGLKDYFGYNNDAQCLDRSNYSYDQWEDIIYRHIQTVGPIYMSGDDGTSGHAFVCDGYSSDGYFHFNWGWGGYYDGYFLLTALNPTEQGTGGNTGGFNYNQQVLANLTKPGGATIELPELSPLMLYGSLTATATGDKTLSITSDYAGSNYPFVYNRSEETIKVRFSIKLVNTSTNAEQIIESLATDYDEFPQYYGCNSISFTYNNFTQGEYRLYVVAQLYDDDEWFDPLCSEGCTNYVNLVINSKGNIESVITPVEGSVDAKNLTATSNIYWGQKFSYSFTAFNSGSTEASDVLFPAFCVLNSNNSLSIIAYGNDISITLAAGETKDYLVNSAMTLNTDSDYSGETVYFCLVNSDYSLLDYTSITILSADQTTIEATAFSYDGDAGDVDPITMTFNCGVKCTNGQFSDRLYVGIIDADMTKLLTYFGTDETMTISAGSTQNFQITGSYEDASEGDDYYAALGYISDNQFHILSTQAITIGEERSGIAKVADNRNTATVKADRDADRLTISAPTTISSVNVYSLDGRNRRLNIKLGTTEVSTSMAELPAGVNIVKVTLSDGSSTITKIVK
jgi:hypothetical protein